jgi:hypothetical protein
MMLQTSSVPNPGVVFGDVQLVLDGRIAPRLVWEKHALSLGVGVLLVLMLALLTRRLLVGPRPKVILQQAAIASGKAREGR